MTRVIIFLMAMILPLIFIGPVSAQDRAVPQENAQIKLSFAPLVKQVSPAVVNIYAERVVTQRVSPFMSDPFFEQFFGGSFGFGSVPRQRVENALGSGVIVAADGLVVTNAHVVEDADEIKVILPDEREFDAVKVLSDERSDLALLRFDTEGEDVPFVEMAPSESLEVGDLVLAIGNPFGVGQTVTSGIVSALARSSLNINDFNFFIQTDAAINPGNSGGPLIAMDGKVVGINSAIYSRSGGSMGIGFAIPSEMVATVIAAEVAGQAGDNGVIRPWLGVSAQKVTSDIAKSLDLKRPIGVLIAALHSHSPARKAGLNVGDVVLAVNGNDVRDPSEMKFRMATVPLGEHAVFSVLSKGRNKDIRVEAIAPPDKPDRDETVLSGRHPFDGVTVANLNPAVALEYALDVDEEKGVVAVGFVRRNLAMRFLGEGDIIKSVNGKAIQTVNDLVEVLKTRSARGWEVVISSGGLESRILLR
ncbi:MAG: Do family serine endopeptidase [Pseudomonadota bacterium]|nr:Do family serine endopeptidase [Pseudomonadota bacterium]MEC8664567.1 Do family serine endopeptidase [Pseudomonadota bacterium]